jgi:RHS repeat-associated protein
MQADAANGLDYDRARWYSPVAGRFTSQDPIGFRGTDTNLYRYVTNNPANATDPTGEQDPLDIGPAKPANPTPRPPTWDDWYRDWYIKLYLPRNPTKPDEPPPPLPMTPSIDDPNFPFTPTPAGPVTPTPPVQIAGPIGAILTIIDYLKTIPRPVIRFALEDDPQDIVDTGLEHIIGGVEGPL